MYNVIKVRPYSKGKSTMILNGYLANELGLLRKKRGYISFGVYKSFVDLIIYDKCKDNEIFLSKDIFEEMHMPEYVEYEIRIDKNEIALGPCIGILASKKYASITKRRLQEISMNVSDYSNVHGAIIAFSLDKVDPSSRTVDGYCYNPGNQSWEKGIFPYPSAIYNRSSLNERWKNHFLSVIGDTVFNNYNFGKWQMFQWFSNEKDIMRHLPYTKLYKNSKDILEMLNKYKAIYVKPIWGMKGFDVVKISIEKGRTVFKYRKDDVNRVITCENIDDVEKTCKALFTVDSHIIQQGIDLLSNDGGVIDFRCVMQKNDSSDWVCNAIVARTGAKNSVVSNISSGGMALPAEELFKELLSFNEAEAFVMKEKMIHLCMKICNTLDACGINCGTLGLDLGVDKQQKLWLIEVNNRSPHPAIALRANEMQAYHAILCHPLYYAKSLAGFGS